MSTSSRSLRLSGEDSYLSFRNFLTFADDSLPVQLFRPLSPSIPGILDRARLRSTNPAQLRLLANLRWSLQLGRTSRSSYRIHLLGRDYHSRQFRFLSSSRSIADVVRSFQLPWLRLDALMLNLIWGYIPLARQAVPRTSAWAFRVGALNIPISFGWAAGDVSLAGQSLALAPSSRSKLDLSLSLSFYSTLNPLLCSLRSGFALQHELRRARERLRSRRCHGAPLLDLHRPQRRPLHATRPSHRQRLHREPKHLSVPRASCWVSFLTFSSSLELLRLYELERTTLSKLNSSLNTDARFSRIQFTVGSVIILLATLIPVGAFALNPSTLGGVNLGSQFTVPESDSNSYDAEKDRDEEEKHSAADEAKKLAA